MSRHSIRRTAPWKFWPCLSIVFAAVLVTVVQPAYAVPVYYVQSIARAETSGNITDGQGFFNDTGHVHATSNSAGPFTAQSHGTSYDFNASADVLTEIGAVHGSASIAASSTGPAGGANASAQGQWSDTVTITSDTLPNNAPVSFLATIVLHRSISGIPGTTVSAEVNGPFGLHLIDSLSSPNSTESVSTLINTFVGSTLSPTSTLTLTAGGSGLAPFNFSGAAVSENTAVFQFKPITPGASYRTDSGVTFVPEPASAFMMLCGSALLSLWGARAMRARNGDQRVGAG
jgi:hypothetical protein